MYWQLFFIFIFLFALSFTEDLFVLIPEDFYPWAIRLCFAEAFIYSTNVSSLFFFFFFFKSQVHRC